MARLRILSGMRPSGKLHIGHLLGALSNWRRLQDEGNETYYMVADWHALTTEYENSEGIQSNIIEMVYDWLAAGLDPKKSVIFVQSHVKEHAELYLLFSMITPLGWLERVPTYKEALEEYEGREIATHGFLGYPMLQAADILVYKAHAVPVGQDQLPHLEFTRELARRFHHLYGEVFPEPQSMLTETPLIRGIDGRKMSKRYGNAILLSDSEEETTQKVMQMLTDPARKRRTDPGNPDICPVFDLQKIFAPREWVERVDRECRTAEIGCVEDKQALARYLNEYLRPFRSARSEFASDPKRVKAILAEGAERARASAAATMDEVRKAMRI
ncbi:MAG: tryptophan--tRNA ligase [Candidatus Abyssobacteria bacterium SURF_17]|uniref:Tryptophan--tRNA ligase n=1 Tax=Candidatus Abyssobacteria bacterium SURF_17 TaxID=2093361 RepID=A0A419F8E5_9BACT|nr:MAG: tryptophan--tRNA ligase [Candidatus Abyssubacteria bacterium SURF_17]